VGDEVGAKVVIVYGVDVTPATVTLFHSVAPDAFDATASCVARAPVATAVVRAFVNLLYTACTAAEEDAVVPTSGYAIPRETKYVTPSTANPTDATSFPPPALAVIVDVPLVVVLDVVDAVTPLNVTSLWEMPILVAVALQIAALPAALTSVDVSPFTDIWVLKFSMDGAPVGVAGVDGEGGGGGK